MLIACHQPNLLPWLPFFEKMKEVDLFVILGHCQWEKGKYQNRFRLNDRWHTMAVNHGLQAIHEKHYVKPGADWAKIKQQLPKHQNTLSRFDPLISTSLLWTNFTIIEGLAKILGIKTKIAFDFPTELKATDRLVAICRHYKANAYLAGTSGSSYMEMDKFKEAGISVKFQDLDKADRRHTLEVISAI